MSANYVQKINNNAIAASETVPSSNLATTLAGKEEVSNKKQSIDDTSTIEYPSSKAVADFVNSSVSTSTATYRGNYNVVSDLSLTYDASELQIATALISAISTTPDNNDYCFVQIPTATATPTIIDHVDRYKFDGTNWAYEYTLNNSGFTAAEWATIQSGITSSDKTTWNNHISNTTVHVTSSDKTTWNNKQDSLGIGKSTKKLSELINSTNILVTARWSDRLEKYLLDRTLEELLDSINKGIVPVLRVVKNDNISFYNMSDKTDDSITFKAPVEYGIESGTKILIPKFLYANTGFTDMSTKQPISGITIDLIDIE